MDFTHQCLKVSSHSALALKTVLGKSLVRLYTARITTCHKSELGSRSPGTCRMGRAPWVVPVGWPNPRLKWSVKRPTWWFLRRAREPSPKLRKITMSNRWNSGSPFNKKRSSDAKALLTGCRKSCSGRDASSTSSTSAKIATSPASKKRSWNGDLKGTWASCQASNSTSRSWLRLLKSRGTERTKTKVPIDTQRLNCPSNPSNSNNWSSLVHCSASQRIKSRLSPARRPQCHNQQVERPLPRKSKWRHPRLRQNQHNRLFRWPNPLRSDSSQKGSIRWTS